MRASTVRPPTVSEETCSGGSLKSSASGAAASDNVNLIVTVPVSRAVRGAAYHVLAGLPGVRALGTVTDQRGRSGQAVATTERQAGQGTFEVRLIFDPNTGAPLAREYRAVAPAGRLAWLKAGQLSSYALVLAPEATDDNPPAVITPSR